MPLSIDDLKQIILLEVGAGLDGLPDIVRAATLDKVTPWIDNYWQLWAGKAYYPGLQKAYVKKECIQVLMGQVRDLVPTSIEGINIAQDHRLTNLLELLKEVNEDITKMETEAAKGRAPAMAAMASDFQMDPQGRLYNPLAPVVRGDSWRWRG